MFFQNLRQNSGPSQKKQESLYSLFAHTLIAKATAPDLKSTNLLDFCKNILKVRLWRKQREIARLIQECEENTNLPKYREILARTGHGIGKTFLLSCVVPWWLTRYGPGTVVITSAPTFRQVEKLLWVEIQLRWRSSKILQELGVCRTTTIRMYDPSSVNQEFHPKYNAHGFSTDEPEKFQGFHAPVLRALIDEANGFPTDIWQSLDTCLTGANSQLVAIGNSVLPYGKFFEDINRAANPIAAAETKTVAVKISSRSHPNVRAKKELIPGAVTHDWIADFEGKYRAFPDVIASRIDAEFPKTTAKGIISRDYIERALNIEPKTWHPKVLSIDIARHGDCSTVVMYWHGQLLEKIWEWSQQPLTETSRKILDIADIVDPTLIVIDEDGVGGGVVDIVKESKYPVMGFRGGLPPLTEHSKDHYVNRISEAWYLTREFLDHNLLALRHKYLPERLIIELSSREGQMQNDKKLRVESKDAYKSRTGFASPDYADAFVMGIWGLSRYWSNGGNLYIEQEPQRFLLEG